MHVIVNNLHIMQSMHGYMHIIPKALFLKKEGIII